MAWNTTELKTRFSWAENAAVVHYLELDHPSAHSDVAEEMFIAADRIKDRRCYCPDGSQYAYCFLHTKAGVIYSLAVGMKNLTFRLPEDEIPMALADGGELFSGIGGPWVSFNPFLVNESTVKTRARMKSWCELAHQFACSA